MAPAEGEVDAELINDAVVDDDSDVGSSDLETEADTAAGSVTGTLVETLS
jgi:hypothetical protein